MSVFHDFRKEKSMIVILPTQVEDFLGYMETIKGKSINTVKAYKYDLILFFRYMKIRRKLVTDDTSINEINISDIDDDFIKKIALADLYGFLAYVANKRDNKSYARARKVACLRSFFKYLNIKARLIDENPAIELETPKTGERHPAHLTLSESTHLLDNIISENPERDYAIITIFLNCGLRLSELCGIDINRIKDDTLTVIGKGDKERTVYLNDACKSSIDSYLKIRAHDGVKDRQALFLSSRKSRISTRMVQYIVKKQLELAGLDADKISPHKLRHTAATLMYKHGNVDIRALQQILGHVSISTTQIYTHVDDERLRTAVKANPLANIKRTE